MSARIWSNNTISGWKNIHKATGAYLISKGYENINNDELYRDSNGFSFFVLPLREMARLYRLRKKLNNYESPVLFLVGSENEYPIRTNYALPKEDKEKLLGNPKYGNIEQAILKAELIKNCSNDASVTGYDGYVNLICVINEKFPDNLLNAVSKIFRCQLCENSQKLRQQFYETFVGYYFPSEWPDDSGLREPKNMPISTIFTDWPCEAQTLKDLYNSIDFLYCKLNGIPYSDRSLNDRKHSVEYEFMRAPIAFELQGLIDARGSLRKTSCSQMRLLLIDNHAEITEGAEKRNKFIAGDAMNGYSPGPLCELLVAGTDNDQYGLKGLFQIQMLGNIIFKARDGDGQPGFFDSDDCKLDNDCTFNAAREQFNFRSFLYDERYKEFVYEKVRQAHFVLLDFFLDEHNTYLAFDFIHKISEIKRDKGDPSTTWYFITSAVYDSVVKYSQSGLLAEYYENAVVNAGDDPTNPKRQIIFLYKLLTFIQARIKSFEVFEEGVLKNKVFTCKEKTPNPGCTSCTRCLQQISSIPRKYLAEYEEVAKVFPSLAKEEVKKVAELIIIIIDQFYWLPEADWAMIQMQIQLLNKTINELKGYNKTEFKCEYILKELCKRSKIY